MSLTESPSLYHNLEKMTTRQIIESINAEDRKVPEAMAQALPTIEKLIDAAAEKMLAGGRLFYIGAGTSGRLAIVDASECPPTFGVPHDLVIALMAGGDKAIRHAAEGAEDSTTHGWDELQLLNVSKQDFVIGITASGRTPYVAAALQKCHEQGIMTACIVCNSNTAMAAHVDYPVEILVGPEFVTGSTRMKAGTAQKLALNMISTSLMIRMGRVEGNRMVNMKLGNDKLIDRGVRMVMEKTGLDYAEAKNLLLQYDSVKSAIDAFKN